ncbi:Chromatin-remodeling ATPase INO80 [Labeo rohita]|uniref:Chromatin-remodeling ATPase INO80 n=1 Tax=Labeo rohita TaxID=84645 RepID=A0ABQ8LZM2_LABRO|nr:Chromatin-remodeling ATPase INO80 [Labeo rohita]
MVGLGIIDLLRRCYGKASTEIFYCQYIHKHAATHTLHIHAEAEDTPPPQNVKCVRGDLRQILTRNAMDVHLINILMCQAYGEDCSLFCYSLLDCTFDFSSTSRVLLGCRFALLMMFSFMDYLEFLFLLLEQGEHSHENHTKDFVDFTKETHYPDDCLITFYLDDDTSPTLDPELSPPSPHCAEHQSEPTADGEPEPTVTDEPSPERATELSAVLPVFALPYSSPLPLFPVSLICAVDSARVCQSPSVSWLDDPLSQPLTSESQTPPRPINQVAPPWLLALSSPPWPVSPPGPLGSLVPPAPPWSVVDHLPFRNSTPLAAPHPSVPLALSGSSFPSAPPWFSVAPAPPWHSGSPSPPRSPEPSALPWPSRSFLSPWLIGSPSPPWAPLPPAPPPSVSPLESSAYPPLRFHRGLCSSSSSQLSILLWNLHQSPFTIPHPLLCPPPKSLSVPPFVVAPSSFMLISRFAVIPQVPAFSYLYTPQYLPADTAAFVFICCYKDSPLIALED